ncbi:cytochrome c oxidase assembly protein COX20, mitochondrial [Anabrus simplex]|uniref:cytochrome c oxidase assembly protein COX20, mitochondrial n=1 Tax=Anabrus simplex TaxID=316456 RepID=UPI0035A2BA00
MSDDYEPSRSFVFFGRDVSQIPCFRNTFLYSISGGIATGLTYFLFTSRVGMASHVGFGSFVGISFTYWFFCRYQWSKRRIEFARIQKALQQVTMYEGTEMEKQLSEKLGKTETPLEKEVIPKLEEVENVDHNK